MNGAATLTHRILANDLRLFFRAWQRQGASRFSAPLLQLVFVGWMHVAAFPLLARFDGSGPLAGGAEFASACIVLLIVMVALQRSLEVLYNRGDLPMLLASPVPHGVVVFTRLADIQVTSAISSALVMLPLLNVAAWVYGAHWLWAWLGWALAVFAIVPCALLVTITGVRVVGARRARTMLQIVSILVGITAVGALQAPSWFGRADEGPGLVATQAAFFGAFDQPGLRELAGAARGDLRWLAALGAIALVASGLAFRGLVRSFASGAQAAAGDLGAGPRATDRAVLARIWRRAFRESPTRTIIRKELRLVLRDPLLIVRGSSQMVSLVPALIGTLLWHKAVGLASFALVGPAIVAVTLAALMTMNDDAHVFIASSPLSPRRAAWARTAAAAAVPIALGVALAAGVWLVGEPVLAALTAAGSILNAVALAWLGTCSVRPLSPEERARLRQPKIIKHYLFAILVGSLGSGAIAMLVAGQFVVAAIVGVLAVGCAAFAFARHPRPWAETGS